MSAIQTGDGIVEQTMSHLLPCKFDGPEARVMLLAIGLQESGFEMRQQKGGPARSFWQFEQGGGIHGVLTHKASSQYACSVCGLRAVAPIESDVYAAFLSDDQLGCAFARLLLWTDSAPLPAVGDDVGARAYYVRNWRPGAWTHGTAGQISDLEARWSRNYAAALAAVVAESTR